MAAPPPGRARLALLAVFLLPLVCGLAACGQYSGVHPQQLTGPYFRRTVAFQPASQSVTQKAAVQPIVSGSSGSGRAIRHRHTDHRGHRRHHHRVARRPDPQTSGVPGGTGTPPVPPPLPNAQMVTYPQWASLLLARIHAPACGNNLIAVVAWEVQERTQAAWNPLATTQTMPGSTPFNGVGVQNYPSLQEGLDATVATFAHGWSAHGYTYIVGALQQCAQPSVTAQAINQSDWCAGCAGGGYVVALIPSVTTAYVQAYG